MTNKLISDLAKVLVNNFYSNKENTNNLSGDFVSEILMGLTEADIEFGGIGFPVKMSVDRKGMVISSTKFETSESLTWDQVPKVEDKKEVLVFIERILKEYFYA